MKMKNCSVLLVALALIFSLTLCSSAYAATLSISPTTLPNGTVDEGYNQILTAVNWNANGVTYWSKASGDLPPGLKVSGRTLSTGRISGTPTTAGTYTFTIQVMDKNFDYGGNTRYAKRQYTITISGTSSTSNPEISETFPSGTVNVPYSSDIAVVGGTSPYKWSHSGTIPSGMTLTSSDNTCTLSGTPTTAGTYPLKVIVTDSNNNMTSKDMTVTIATPPISNPTINGSFTSSGTRNSYYSSQVTVSGGTTPYRWSYSGTLPSGLTLASSGSTFTLSGTPTANGTYTFNVTVADNNDQTASRNMTVTIGTQEVSDYPKINGLFRSYGNSGRYYSSEITASGGTAPYTWSYTGTLPTGMSFSSSGNSYTLRGTPTASGSYTFTVRVRDNNSHSATKTLNVKIQGTEPEPLTGLPEIYGSFTSSATKDVWYSSSITVGGAIGTPITWSYSGTRPSGLSLTSDGATYTLSGIPTTSGPSNFTVSVTGGGSPTVERSMSVTVSDPSNGMTISGTFDDGVLGRSYYEYVSVSGGSSPYTWSHTGTLPDGLELGTLSGGSGYTCHLSGTPTKAGTFTFTLTATDKDGKTASKNMTVEIKGSSSGLTINYTFASGTVGTEYRDYVTVSGGTAPYTWEYAGTPPTGTSFSLYGTDTVFLTGTPTREGTYTFTLTVTDNNSLTANKRFTVSISGSSGGGGGGGCNSGLAVLGLAVLFILRRSK